MGEAAIRTPSLFHRYILNKAVDILSSVPGPTCDRVVPSLVGKGKSMRQGLLTLLLLLASFTNAGASMVQDGSSEDAKRSQPGEQKDEKKGRAKDKKKVEELRPGSAEGDEIEKLMRDITDGMKRIEDLLKERETGQATQSAQQSTLDSIEELIKAAEKAQQQSQSSGSGSGGKPKNDKERGQQDQKQGQQQRQNKDQSELNREEDGQKDADKERQENESHGQRGAVPTQ